MVDEKVPDTLDNIVMFHNLTRMELIFRARNPLLTFKCLMKLLQYCPKLQSLIVEVWNNVKFFFFYCIPYIIYSTVYVYGFQVIAPSEDFHDKDWEEPQIIPKCLISHLSTCSLRNYRGITCELHFAKYIIKNSRVLGAMKIQSAEFLDTTMELQMKKELSECLKNSTACKLLFIWLLHACIMIYLHYKCWTTILI